MTKTAMKEKSELSSHSQNVEIFFECQLAKGSINEWQRKKVQMQLIKVVLAIPQHLLKKTASHEKHLKAIQFHSLSSQETGGRN